MSNYKYKQKEAIINSFAFKTDEEFEAPYPFTEEEIQRMNQVELTEYEERTAMTGPEKRALRKWVASGHSLHEHPGSKYICLNGAYPPPDFLDVYRMDQEIAALVKGIRSKEARISVIREYMGFEEETTEDRAKREAHEQTPSSVKQYIQRLERELFYLHEFVCTEGLLQEAEDYVEERKDEPIPFEFY